MRSALSWLLGGLVAAAAYAQSPATTLTGRVVDQRGEIVAGAVVAHGTDIIAMVHLLEFFFFFVLSGVCGAMALVLTFICYRCWRAM